MPTANDRSNRYAFWTWFPDFLRRELAPYPGRWGIVARMVVASTAVAVVCMTFRIPRAYQGAVYAFLVSHETLENNRRAAFRIAVGTVLTTVYMLVSAGLCAGSPPLHFLWNVASFFLAFFCVSAMREYAAAVPVAVVIGTAAVSWDRPLPAGANVADTLWLCLASTVGVVVTAVVSSVFAAFSRRDVLIQPLADKLRLVEEALRSRATGISVPSEIARQLNDVVLAGNSAWRLTLRRSGSTRPDRDRLGTTGDLIARLADIAANLPAAGPAWPDASRLADLLEEFRAALVEKREPSRIHAEMFAESSLPIRQIAQTLELLTSGISGGMDSAPARFQVFAPDALTNPEHLKFAFRGCLAATICYVVYNAVAWQGLSSAIASCMFTAVSTVGASTQKLAIRLAGAILGGAILGMGIQIFVFPRVDSIFAFALVFGVVSAIAAWFMTCSPRLSYLGLQIALAFDLVHLQSFRFETSIAAARDRVAGVILGLAAMWLVFDHLWSSTAGVLMKRSFVRSLRLLAQLAREPVSKDSQQALRQSSALRETTSTTLDQTQSLSDGVLFEFGPNRPAALDFRKQVRRLQPQLRSLLVMRVSALDYRLRLPGFELSEVALKVQKAFDEHSAGTLEELANEIESGAARRSTLPESRTDRRAELLDPSQLALLEGMKGVIGSLAKQIDGDVVQQAAKVK
jgi:multidrug resistance protein MdtO